MIKRGVLTALAAVLLTAAPAQAVSVGTLETSGGFSGVPLTITYKSVVGAENIVVTGSAYEVTIKALDMGVLVSLTDYCVVSNNSTAVCLGYPYQRLVIQAGIGSDRVDSSAWPYPTFVYADQGNDSVVTGAGADQLIGGDNNDYLDGNGGNDILVGGIGWDLMFGRDGDDYLDSSALEPLSSPDHVDCGPGTDAASWLATDVVWSCEQRRS